MYVCMYVCTCACVCVCVCERACVFVFGSTFSLTIWETEKKVT